MKSGVSNRLAAAMLCLAALSASEVSGFPSLKGLSQARRLLSHERLPHSRNQKPETPFRIVFEVAVGAGGGGGVRQTPVDLGTSTFLRSRAGVTSYTKSMTITLVNRHTKPLAVLEQAEQGSVPTTEPA